ncbi:hypothetical protein FA13DRAFT_1734097 [Coprinellus micaceus]|uniref:Caffeine-induced death protein 2 n=1 Tax=Coprinellus micaceus TaxID=71717 RepID=A0A4Y7T8H8_COPMI|nr:hypothetical protein FA13DRAFT_1734097 [Coprinellus micaceus]
MTSASSSKGPQLGSLALQAPTSRPEIVHVTPSTCLNLSLFKDILKEYRKLDDAITTRLNRATALARDQERTSGQGVENAQNQACLSVWRELTENWKRRTKLVDYCVSVVDRSIDGKRGALQQQPDDPALQRTTKAAIYSDEVYRRQMHNEIAVESIVRKRVVDAFHSRCRYFVPPKSDVEAAQLWEGARGQNQ